VDATITTVIPTYQRPRLLERAIKSVLAQTYSQIRVCVYDNASEDETKETVEKLERGDPRVQYFRHSTNIGVIKNFIQGVERVATPFFSILSDDDILLPGFYEAAMAGFRKHPEAMISVLATLQVDERGRVVGAPILQWEPGLYVPPSGFLAMLDKLHPEWTSVVFRREVAAECGGLDEATGAAFDLDYLLRIAGSSPIAVSTEIGAVFVTHTQGLSSSAQVGNTWPCYPKMIENQINIPDLTPQTRTYAREVLERRLRRRLVVTTGLGSIVRKNWADARGAAYLLRDKAGLPRMAAILLAMTWSAEHFPPAHKAILVAHRLKEFMRRFKQRSLQRRYAALAQLARTL
jgi:glycosyltransferase involved in cell wall biosynthesis